MYTLRLSFNYFIITQQIMNRDTRKDVIEKTHYVRVSRENYRLLTPRPLCKKVEIELHLDKRLLAVSNNRGPRSKEAAFCRRYAEGFSVNAS